MKTTTYKSPQLFGAKKVATIAAYLFTIVTGSVNAQGSYKIKTKNVTQTISKMTMYEVKEESLSHFKESLSKYVFSAIASKNNIMAEAFYEQNKPNVLWLIERWNGKSELQDLNETNLVKSKTYYIKDLEALTKEQWRKTAKKEDNQLVIMLFVDAKKGTEQNFKDTYHIVMPQFRSESGVVTYQLSEIEGDETQFVTYEKFRSNEAFQYHLNFPPIQPVIEFLETSIKNPPFQNGLHNLIEFAPLNRE